MWSLYDPDWYDLLLFFSIYILFFLFYKTCSFHIQISSSRWSTTKKQRKHFYTFNNLCNLFIIMSNVILVDNCIGALRQVESCLCVKPKGQCMNGSYGGFSNKVGQKFKCCWRAHFLYYIFSSVHAGWQNKLCFKKNQMSTQIWLSTTNNDWCNKNIYMFRCILSIWELAVWLKYLLFNHDISVWISP